MHMLGEGAFGCVFYAEMKPSPNDDFSGPAQPVAVKMLKCKMTAVSAGSNISFSPLDKDFSSGFQ